MRTRLRGEVKKTTFEIRIELFDRMVEKAFERRMAVVTWLENAIIAQLNREDRYGQKEKLRRLKREAKGMICTYCECPAAECSKPEKHRNGDWWEKDTGQLEQ